MDVISGPEEGENIVSHRARLRSIIQFHGFLINPRKTKMFVIASHGKRPWLRVIASKVEESGLPLITMPPATHNGLILINSGHFRGVNPS